MADTPEVTVIPAPEWLVRIQANRERSVIEDAAVDADPGVYELHRVGGLHVDRVPCDNCDGAGWTWRYSNHSERPGQRGCVSCGGRGNVWPEWATTVMMGVVVDMPEPDQALDRLMEARNTEAPETGE